MALLLVAMLLLRWLCAVVLTSVFGSSVLMFLPLPLFLILLLIVFSRLPWLCVFGSFRCCVGLRLYALVFAFVVAFVFASVFARVTYIVCSCVVPFVVFLRLLFCE